MSSMLPMRRRANEAMLFAASSCAALAGRNALSLKIVIGVGWPISEPRGLLYWNWWL